MSILSHEDKMIGLQRQLQQNQQDLHEFLADLGNWEDEIKAKEEALKNTAGSKSDEPQNLPPVRNSLDKKKLKKKKKKKPDPEAKSKKISGFDFRAWDKYDVDKVLEDMDKEEKKSSSEYETDEEWEIERKKQLAESKKNMGNSHLSAGAYEQAVECYTMGIELDSTNALLPANRALALMKLQRYTAAEEDSTTAISLDPLYVKAYLRRGAARVGLKKLALALEDYERALQLEPKNKQAQAEIERLQKELERENEGARPTTSSLETIQTSEVKVIYKLPEQRSKKPLRRIEIEEIGLKENNERTAAIAKVEAEQSSVKKEMEAKDHQMFEKFTMKASGDNANHSDQNSKNNDGFDASSDNKSQSLQSQVKEDGMSEKLKSTHLNGKSSTLTEKSASSSGQKPAGRLQNGSAVKKPTSPREGEIHIASIFEREPPTTAYQFQADFRILQNDLKAFHSYFKRIDPGVYPTLFGKSLESNILLKIVESFQTYGIPANEDCFNELKNMTKVNRFSTTVMFLSSKDKQGIREVFQFLKSKAEHPESEIDILMKKYEVQ